MGKAICKELGKASAIVLAGRNPAKLETAKAELDELGVESDLCKTDIADRAQVQALADYAASLGSVKQIIHTSGVSPSDTGTENIIKINAVGAVNMVEAFYPVLAGDGVMINFASVAAYTMPQTDEWTDAFEAWNEPNFYDRLLSHAHASEAHRHQPETAENQLELIPAGRWGHPCEMGALTAFLCSSGAGYVNGVDILADGGQNAGIFVPQI